MAVLSDEEVVNLFHRQLPGLLERRPELEPLIYSAFLKVFARRDAVAAVLAELRDFRAEVTQRFEEADARFDQVDVRFEQVDARLDALETGMHDFRAEVTQRFEQVDAGLEQLENGLYRAIDRLGSRWGIRNESLFRQTIEALLEESFAVAVEQRTISGEPFDVLIVDHQHMLVEIAASGASRTIAEHMERKRQLYVEATGIVPSRLILAPSSIHSRRAEALRQQGIEVIELEDDD